MKAGLLAWTLLSSLVASALAAPPAEQAGSQLSVEEAIGAKASEKESSKSTKSDPVAEDEEEEVLPTVFNGITVPPLKEITGPEYAEAIKDGYWFVKHYSPSCPHCQAVAPKWQTLYEFYYTSSPIQAQTKPKQDSQSLNSFHGFYNFHFGSVNCLAYGDACWKHDVTAYPTFILYKDGELVEKYKGDKTMEAMSKFIEEKLEQIRPGSRPKDGVNLPAPGDTSVATDGVPAKPAAKDKDPAAGSAAAEKQNEKAAEATASTGKETIASTAKSQPKKPAKDVPTPNTQGKSVDLTAEDFQRKVTMSEEPWFIKFYAPWCHHCQALAPTWNQMAMEMKGELNIGEVNCDAESRLCKDVRVQGYPTMHFFRGGERVEYDGLRGLGDLLTYTRKALDSDVKYVDAAEFKALEETEEVIFVYFFDQATTSEDFAALDRLTLSLIGHARIVKTDSKALADRFKISTWPRLLVSRDGRPTYYTGLMPNEMRDFRRVLAWMQSVWLPIVPELTASNAHEIMDGRYVVLGALTRQRPDEFKQSKNELKNAALEWMDKQTQIFQRERQELRDAKQLRIEEAEDRNDQRALRQAKSRHISISEFDKKQVGFAWVDAQFWERWLRTTYGIDIKNGERVIINDEDNRRYWDVTETGNFIVPSRTSILETIPRIISSPPKLSPKSTIGFIENIFFQIKSFGSHHRIMTIGFLITMVITFFIYGRRKLNEHNQFGGSALGGAGKKYHHGSGMALMNEKSNPISGVLGGLGGLLSGNGGKGYFHLDGKEGFLNGGGAKAD